MYEKVFHIPQGVSFGGLREWSTPLLFWQMTGLREEKPALQPAPILHSLVTGDAAVYDCLPARVDDYKRQLNGGVQSWRALVLLFILPISLYQVFESDLL